MNRYFPKWKIIPVSTSLTAGMKPTGSMSRSGGLMSAIAKNLKLMNLKAAKRITVTFDPFHPNARQAR